MRAARSRLLRFRRSVDALFRSADWQSAAAEVQKTASWLSGKGYHELAVAVLDVAERRLGPHGDVTRLRRTIPGFLGRASRRHVHAAARRMVGTGPSVQVSAEPLSGGTSPATVAVVRHTAQPRGHTFIRKSVHAAYAREAQLYRSELVSTPGRWFRIPTPLAVERQGRYWHLFLEDLQGGTRPKSSADFVNAARGLGELGARFYGDAAPQVDWLSTGATFRLRPYERGVDTLFRYLPPAEGHRLLGVYGRLCEQEPGLVTHLRSLPRTLCHGDAHANNMVVDPTQPERVVIFDWLMVQIGPVGSDLGRLMSVPSNFLHGAQLDPDACVNGYLDTLQAPAGDRDGIVFACNYVLVWHSLRWWATRTTLTRRLVRPADVDWICDAADALLER